MRIVSLISSATEMLALLGLADEVVGVSHECDWPPEMARKPRVTGSHVDSSCSSRAIDDQVHALTAAGAALYSIDLPLLAELRPDLIVTQAQCDVCAVRYADVLAAVGGHPALRGTRVLALNPQSLADVLDDVRRVGAAAHCQATAQRVVGALEQRIAAVRQAVSSGAERLRVACIEWVEPLMLAGNWVPELVAIAGGEHALTTAGQHSPYVDWDTLVSYDPQVIIVAPCGFDLARTLVEAESLVRLPQWAQLAAVRAGRLFAVDGNAYLNRSGPRLVDTVELLAHLIEPERCALPVALPQSGVWQHLA